MKICALELKGNDAVVCLMSLTDGLFNLHECRVAKLTIADAFDAQMLKKFQFDFSKLMTDYQVQQVVIRSRQTKGKFAGGAVSFKLEAAIELIEGLSVSSLSPAETNAIIKNSNVHVDFDQTGLKKFQQAAFMTGFAFLEQN